MRLKCDQSDTQPVQEQQTRRNTKDEKIISTVAQGSEPVFTVGSFHHVKCGCNSEQRPSDDNLLASCFTSFTPTDLIDSKAIHAFLPTVIVKEFTNGIREGGVRRHRQPSYISNKRMSTWCLCPTRKSQRTAQEMNTILKKCFNELNESGHRNTGMNSIIERTKPTLLWLRPGKTRRSNATECQPLQLNPLQ